MRSYDRAGQGCQWGRILNSDVSQSQDSSVELSIVIPVFGAPTLLQSLVSRLERAIRELEITWEVLLVDDGCPGDSWAIIESLSSQHPFIVGIQHSRNFGQHAAIGTGLGASRGEFVVVMDCDLQDRPELVSDLYRRITATGSKSDLIVALRENRQDSALRKLQSKLYFFLLSKLTGQPVSHEIRNFGIYHRRVISAIRALGDSHQSFGMAAIWVGFQREELALPHDSRPEGRSSFGFGSLLTLGTQSLLSYSTAPLQFMVLVGVLTALGAFCFASYLVIVRVFTEVTVEGWTSVMVAIFFSTGVLLSFVGLLGLYVGMIFDASKGRPSAIVRQQCGSVDG